MRVYAVNCDKGRAERLVSAAAPLDLDIQLVPSPLSNDEEVLRRGKKMLEVGTAYPTGLAATIGHIRAMERFVESGEPLAIIIEDDVRFHKHFNRLIAAVTPHMMEGNTDILSLGYVNPPHGTYEVIGGEYIIRNVGLSNPWGAQCYMITRDYAQRFTQMCAVDDLYEAYKGNFVTDWVIFDGLCRRDVMMLPIAIEGPNEQTIAGSTNKLNILQCVDADSFYL
jgi:GR25 family glycosyltransferase involved in LPS biosynthesis